MEIKKIIACSALIIFLTLFLGCESEGPAERAGKKVDEVMEKTTEKADETAETIKEKAEEAKEAVKKAGE